MDINLLFALGTILVTITAFIVTTSVLVNITRADFKDFKGMVEVRFTDVDNRFTDIEARFDHRFTDIETRFDHRLTAVEGRLTNMEVDVAEIKAICRERTNRDTPA